MCVCVCISYSCGLITVPRNSLNVISEKTIRSLANRHQFSVEIMSLWIFLWNFQSTIYQTLNIPPRIPIFYSDRSHNICRIHLDEWNLPHWNISKMLPRICGYYASRVFPLFLSIDTMFDSNFCFFFFLAGSYSDTLSNHQSNWFNWKLSIENVHIKWWAFFPFHSSEQNMLPSSYSSNSRCF